MLTVSLAMTLLLSQPRAQIFLKIAKINQLLKETKLQTIPFDEMPLPLNFNRAGMGALPKATLNTLDKLEEQIETLRSQGVNNDDSKLQKLLIERDALYFSFKPIKMPIAP